MGAGCPGDGAEVVAMAPSTPGPGTWEDFFSFSPNGCVALAVVVLGLTGAYTLYEWALGEVVVSGQAGLYWPRWRSSLLLIPYLEDLQQRGSGWDEWTTVRGEVCWLAGPTAGFFGPFCSGMAGEMSCRGCSGEPVR